MPTAQLRGLTARMARSGGFNPADVVGDVVKNVLHLGGDSKEGLDEDGCARPPGQPDPFQEQLDRAAHVSRAARTTQVLHARARAPRRVAVEQGEPLHRLG